MAKIIGLALAVLPLFVITGLLIWDNVREIVTATIVGELLLLGFVIGIYLLVGGV